MNKKAYIQPLLKTIELRACLPVASSTPDVNIDPDAPGVDPGDLDVKGGSTPYNVWNDDWSR